MKASGKTILAIGLFAALLLPGCGSTIKGQKLTGEGQGPAAAIKKPELSEPVLGVGDTIDVSVYRNDDLKKIIKIDKTGKIMFPLIGDVQVAGRTVDGLRDELQARLAKYIVNPQVSIIISGTQSQKVLVLGEVKSPGMFTLDVDLFITDAILKAGGPTNDAKMSDIYVIRRTAPKIGAAEKSDLVRFNMKNAIGSGDFANNIQLRNGDIVYVPTLAISDVSWFMSHIASIIGPVVTMETGVVLWPQAIDVLKGKSSTSSFSVPTN